MRFRSVPWVAVAFAAVGCREPGVSFEDASAFVVTVEQVNGGDPPTPAAPLPANRGRVEETWAFRVEARTAIGEPVPFDGWVRVSVEPGTVVRVEGQRSAGRNLRLVGGAGEGVAVVTGVYGPARLWVEDIGYDLTPSDERPACANGRDDDGDVVVDDPTDPGCAYANDRSEEDGSHAAGVSAPVAYALPTLADIQGQSSVTPYPYESIRVNTDAPQEVYVTRVSSDGFYVSDLAATGGYGHLFAFNFNTPAFMQVCDKVTSLSGVVNEFFGFTELSFPSFRVDPLYEGEACPLPEPTVLDAATILDDEAMEALESSVVRIEGYHVAEKFGPKPATDGFGPDRSNCDLNGDGVVDFDSPSEGDCGNRCSADPECAEWTAYSARGNYKVTDGQSQIQINTGTTSFDPTGHRGEVLPAVTGTMRNFSGGSLNWTIETRCTDDLVCDGAGCVPEALPAARACVRPRSLDDNDQGN